MTAIKIGHRFFSASASNFAVSKLVINGFNVKTKEFDNRKIRFHVNFIGFGFGCDFQPKPNRNFWLPHRPTIFILFL